MEVYKEQANKETNTRMLFFVDIRDYHAVLTLIDFRHNKLHGLKCILRSCKRSAGQEIPRLLLSLKLIPVLERTHHWSKS
jgi:hypothetical protein